MFGNKYNPVTSAADEAVLRSDYAAGRAIGNVQLGNEFFFFKEKRKTYYIPYADMTRVFRRVLLIPATMCCGKGDFEVENLVICTAEGEKAQVQLPGERAGKILLEELARLAPHVQVGKPSDSAQKV